MTQTQMANVWHNPLYSFENPFGTPFETLKDTNSIVIMVHPDEIKRCLEEKAYENPKTLEAIYTMERGNQQVETNNHAL